MFITTEGGEGVGKSTQVALLKERLPTLYPGERFDFAHEPGGTPRANEIRARILSDQMKDAGGTAFFDLFVEARQDHVRERIVPNLAAGTHVICDRYVGSTFAYQHYAMHDPVSRAAYDAHAAELTALGAFPDLIVILDASVAVSQARVVARSGQDLTHFDARGVDFHERLREGYHIFAALYPGRTLVVNADQPPEEIHREILASIRALLDNGGNVRIP